MILPNNGKVVIIDDQPDDVKELITSLSKERIPFVHYKEEDLSDLPNSPIENVRLVFLDLELITSTYVGSGSKNITAPIKSRLARILTPKTLYALIIWSKQESKYKEDLLNDFAADFKDYAPIFHASLPKADIIGKDNAVTRIKQELEIEIEKFKSFNALLIWEAIVNQASGNLINEIASLYPSDFDWDKKTKYLLYKLATAYSGKTVDGFSHTKKLKNALYTLTMSFGENIENLIDTVINDEFDKLVSDTPQQIDNFIPLVNKFLLISESNDEVTQPGNLYFTNIELDEKEKEFNLRNDQRKIAIEKLPAHKKDEALSGLEKNIRKEGQMLEARRNELKKCCNDIVVSALKDEVKEQTEIRNKILGSSFSVCLNITPLCDYAQEKAKLFRMLPGVLIRSEDRKYLNSNTAYSYVSDADLRISGGDFLFLFDFRYLYSVDKLLLRGRKVKYRIKQQLLSDIQVKLGAHINRAGVLFVK